MDPCQVEKAQSSDLKLFSNYFSKIKIRIWVNVWLLINNKAFFFVNSSQIYKDELTHFNQDTSKKINKNGYLLNNFLKADNGCN